jgi:DNA-binding LacI/PurR family transcriptional regulator
MKRRWETRVTLRDVADAAGVSISTVSRVIVGHKAMTEATSARVREAMQALGYEPNVLARALRTRVTHSLGLIVQDIANPFYAEVTKGAERAAAEAGYNLILGDSDYDGEREHALLVDLARRHVDGVLLMAVGTPRRSIEVLQSREVPFVLMDVEVDRYERVNAVLTDPEAGVYDAMRYLIGLGHRRIAFLVGRPESLSYPHIVDAYRRAMDEESLSHDGLLQHCDFTLDGAAEVTRALLDGPRPTAIVALSDLMALGIYQAANERGLQVPRDLSVIGFDDTPMARFLNPALTSVAQEKYEIGARAVQLVLEQIKQGRPSRRIVTLQPRLVVRESCALLPP